MTAATFVAVASLGGELAVSVGLTLVIGSTLKYAWDRGYDAVDETLKIENSHTSAGTFAADVPVTTKIS